MVIVTNSKINPQYLQSLAMTLVAALVLLVVTFSSTALAIPATQEATVDQQQLYQQTLTAIKKGHKTRTKNGLEQLQQYPLYPYLLKAQLSRQLNRLPTQEVNQFLADYGSTVAGKQLQKQWLLKLAQHKQWQQLISHYDPAVANNKLRCLYLEALHQTDHKQIALEQTATIWLSAKSLPNACNSVFKRWQLAGMQTDALVWQRINLALNAKNTLLARYLSKHASAKLKPYTRRLLSVHRDPRRLIRSSDFEDGSSYSIDIVDHGLRRLAPKDHALATRLWVDYQGLLSFSAVQHAAIRDKIARQIIGSGSDDALQWLITYDPNAEDSYLLEWRIRLAIRQMQWSQANHWLSMLPVSIQAKPRWRYWQARSWQQLGINTEPALAILQRLARERHYYGFLAADTISQTYGFNHQTINNEIPLQDIASNPAVLRAQQFYQLDELISARREWREATKQLNQQQLLAATTLAHQWGWHQQAIHTTLKAGHRDDLDVRFPLAYQADMLSSAKSSTINPEWLYAIARQESAFARDAYSSAGARGLLQLRPGTAKQVAKKQGIPYLQRDLFQPEKNIKLGSNYLKSLLADFDGNRILATAAYNAGPHRVKKWLQRQQGSLPYDIWIETLPFYETRNYVQNVLAFSVIYGHRLGNNSPLIGQQELLIGNPLTLVNGNQN